MNRLMARKRIWIALALALPVVVALIGVLIFQVMCSFWCRQVGLFGFVGFNESVLVAGCASTAIVGLAYLMLWQRSVVAAHHRTHTGWLFGSMLMMLSTIIPILIILTPLFPGQIGFLNNMSLLVLMSWGVATVFGMLLRISLTQAWSLNSGQYSLWARHFAGSWNWGWLIMCLGGGLILIAGFVIHLIIPLVVGWIICWCIGWWKIGIPIGLWLNQEVRPTVG